MTCLWAMFEDGDVACHSPAAVVRSCPLIDAPGRSTANPTSHRLFRASISAAIVTAWLISLSVTNASAQITMVHDTFTGANGTSLASHTPDVNLPLTNWTIRTNGALVLNGNAVLSTQGDGWTWPSWAAIQSNTCDGTIAVDWTPGAGMPYGPRSGLIFRMSDANNYWYAGYGMQGTPLGLWKV